LFAERDRLKGKRLMLAGRMQPKTPRKKVFADVLRQRRQAITAPLSYT
jgi:hypothetical protein